MPIGFLSQFSETTRVYFDDDKKWWADVKRHLPRKDFKAAQSVLIAPEMHYVGDVADTKGKVDTGGYQNELVVRALVAWNLTDESGTDLPLAPEGDKRNSVDMLPEDAFQKILAVIEGANRKKPEEQKAEADAFREVGSGGALASGRQEVPAAIGAGPVPD